ncbi:hypothetical protein [Candidatus Mesenet endosymbiont of Phosphuga atrata]|uniref:hypothetical protein n=1 Tax=Candidatus Mesenet endosymbiont of Phosphuga atrata TaxID=3066221 RepID=UPI0030CCD074
MFASQESLSCFQLFLSAHEKNKEVYNKDNIKNIFIDPNFSEDQINLVKLLLDNDIPIDKKDTTKLSIKNVLRIDLGKQGQLFLKHLLYLYKEDEIKLSRVEAIFPIDNAGDIIEKFNDLEKIKENFEFIDFLFTYSVNKENIGKIFSYDDITFNKIKNEDNRELLRLLLQHQATYSVDKIKDIFSFEDDIFNKMKENLELTECLLKYKFDVSDIKYFFSKENSCFEAVKKNSEQIIKYVSDHKLNFANIKKVNFHEGELFIKLMIPENQLSNPSVEGLTGQKMSK